MPQKPKMSVGHFAMHVRDVDMMVDFYTKVVGLTITDRGTVTDAELPMIFMSSDPAEHHQVVLIGGRPEDENFQLNHHLALIMESLEDLRGAYERLSAIGGIDDLRTMTHGNAWSIYFNDPEGNGIEFYTRTPWHVAQPNITPIDLTQPDPNLFSETEKFCRAGNNYKSIAERRSEMAEMMQGQA